MTNEDLRIARERATNPLVITLLDLIETRYTEDEVCEIIRRAASDDLWKPKDVAALLARIKKERD